jgi:arginyl-tRNA synthetase
MNSHLNFDIDAAADSSDNNPVFYLQYAHARICNIIKRGEGLGMKSSNGYDITLLTHSSEIELLKSIGEFPEIMALALKILEPQDIVNYLQDLAARFHRFYVDCRVITDDENLSEARLALIKATKIVLSNGLKTLGITAPERM